MNHKSKLISIMAIGLLSLSSLNASEYVPGTNQKTPTSENIAKLYVSTFDRAPDTGGLNYWKGNNKSLSQMAQVFFTLSEVKAKYPNGTSTESFIKSIYRNMLNREVDSGGLIYWTNEINSGRVRRDELIVKMIHIINAQVPTYPDRIILDNKTKVAMSFYYSNFNVDNYHLNIAHNVVTNVDKYSGSVLASEQDLTTYRVNERAYNIKKFLNKYKKPAIILVMGQSNIANHGATNYKYTNPNVYSYFNKNIRIANTQASAYGVNKHLASGNQGNFLAKLGYNLIKYKGYDGVIFVNIAMGGSYSKDWVPNHGYVERKDSIDNYEFRTGYFERVKEAAKYQDYIGRKYTHVLWQQGESDNIGNVSKNTYINNLLAISNGLYSVNIKVPMYIALASYYKGNIDWNIHNAQVDLPKKYPSRFKAGPNMDSLNSNYRLSDNLHFNYNGLDREAYLWSTKIK